MKWREHTINLIDYIRDGLDWLDDELLAIQGTLRVGRIKAQEPGPWATWHHGPIRSGPNPLRHLDPSHPSMRAHEMDDQRWLGPDAKVDVGPITLPPDQAIFLAEPYGPTWIEHLRKLRETRPEMAANFHDPTNEGDDAA
jgi:hypothetical protein